MRSTLYTLIILLSSFSVVSAQKVTVQWTENTLKEKVTSPLIELVLSDDNTFIAARGSHTKSLFENKITISSIERYNSDGKLLTQYILENPKMSSLRGCLYSDKSFLYLISETDKKAKTDQLLLALGDEKGNIVREEPIITYPSSPQSEVNTYSLNTPDNHKLLLVSHNVTKDEKNAQTLDINILIAGNDGKALTNKNIRLDDKDDRFSYLSAAAINNKGDVLFILKTFNKENKKLRDVFKVGKEQFVGYSLSSYILPFGSSVLQKVDIPFDEMNALTVSLNVSRKNDNFLYTGSICDKSGDHFTGIFYGEIAPDGSLIQNRKSLFAESKRDQNFVLNNDGTTAFDYKPIGIYPRQDGGSYTVFECNITLVVQASGSYTVSYISRNIIVSSFDKNGELQYHKLIPKKQRNAHTSFLSVIVAVVNDNLHLIYNEKPSNVNKDFSAKFETSFSKDLVTIMRIIDKEGNISTRELFSNKTDQMAISPELYLQSNDNTIIIYGGKFHNLFINEPRLGILKIEY